MKRSFQKSIINWIKRYPVIFWSLKIMLAILIGAVAFSVAKATLKDLPASLLLGVAMVYAYVGFQITHHTKAKRKELLIFARMSVALIFLSILAGILGFIFVSQAFGWISIGILMYTAVYLVIRMLKESEPDIQKAVEEFSSTVE